MADLERIIKDAIDCGFRLHSKLGPGLLETVYEAILAAKLKERGYHVQRQVPIKIQYDGIAFDEGFRADLVVEGSLLIELKATERFAPVHFRQVLTYLRLMDLRIGLLMNFGSARFKDGIRRIANDYSAPAS
jgi:GxxExxY protein